jgi:asparagine synthase (glutamine-hydrolysing)
MCGLLCHVQEGEVDLAEQTRHLTKASQKIKHRGPDRTRQDWISENVFFSFHRLEINGLGVEHGLPIIINGCTLICNGEIYNHKEIYESKGITPTTKNDCEVIIHLYRLVGIDEALRQLRGVFAFCLYDHHAQTLFVANDPIGIRPLYMGRHVDGSLTYASEPCALVDICSHVEWFPPGHLDIIGPGGKRYRKQWCNIRAFPCDIPYLEQMYPREPFVYGIRGQLIRAVGRRVHNTERPLACLLSGGLDSSLVSSIAARIIAPKTLHTFTIGFADSPDIMAARTVAEFIGSEHHEVIVTPAQMLVAIEEVVVGIQSYDVTTVRASVFNFMLAKHIAAETDFKVILNGDCSEEVHASYAYSRYAPSPVAFLEDNRRLLEEVHYYDVLRSARSIEHFGMEARTPFADIDYIEYAMGIPPQLKMWGPSRVYPMEKGLLREAFDGYLPQTILKRPKTAFSDGISLKEDSWHEMTQEHCKNTIFHVNDWMDCMAAWRLHGMADGPRTPEAYVYAQHYQNAYGDREDMWRLIPAHWMPRFVDATDPSARTLE